jgi:hypothetical protein
MFISMVVSQRTAVQFQNRQKYATPREQKFVKRIMFRRLSSVRIWRDPRLRLLRCRRPRLHRQAAKLALLCCLSLSFTTWPHPESSVHFMGRACPDFATAPLTFKMISLPVELSLKVCVWQLPILSGILYHYTNLSHLPLNVYQARISRKSNHICTISAFLFGFGLAFRPVNLVPKPFVHTFIGLLMDGVA